MNCKIHGKSVWYFSKIAESQICTACVLDGLYNKAISTEFRKINNIQVTQSARGAAMAIRIQEQEEQNG